MSVQLVGRVAIMKSGRCEETPERYDCCHLPPKEVDGGAMERTTNARTHCQGDGLGLVLKDANITCKRSLFMRTWRTGLLTRGMPPSM